MNWDEIVANWKRFVGKLLQHWGKLTHDDLQEVKGGLKALAGTITKEEAERQIHEWRSKL